MSLEVAEMSNIKRGTVCIVQELRLVGPDRLSVPLTAKWYYSYEDPYAVRMSFDVGIGTAVVWTFGRDLLAGALRGPEGIGDVRAWPSAASASTEREADSGERILNIMLGSPDGCARFEVSADGIVAFLARTYELVPDGQESACLNLDAELTELLS
jgi:Streptomyces sporulation and cell division protein, SsgA